MGRLRGEAGDGSRRRSFGAMASRGRERGRDRVRLGRGEEAAELLGIPSSIMQVGLVPVAYTIGTDFKPAQRPPLDDITHWERW